MLVSRTLAPHSDAALLPASHRRFRTASLDQCPDTSPGELDALGAHAETCRGSRGFWWKASCVAESVARFMAPRLVTTGVAIAIILGLGSLFA